MIIKKKYIPMLKKFDIDICKSIDHSHSESEIETELQLIAKGLPKVLFSGVDNKIKPYEQRRAKSLVLVNKKLLFGLKKKPNTTEQKRNLAMSLTYFRVINACLNNKYSAVRCAQAMSHILRYIYFDVKGQTKHHVYKKMMPSQAAQAFYKDNQNKQFIILNIRAASYTRHKDKQYTTVINTTLAKGKKRPQYCVVTYAPHNTVDSFPLLDYSPIVTITPAVFQNVESSFRHLLLIFLDYGLEQFNGSIKYNRAARNIYDQMKAIQSTNIRDGSLKYLSNLIALCTVFRNFLSNHSKMPKLAGPFHITSNLTLLLNNGTDMIYQAFTRKYPGSEEKAQRAIENIEKSRM